MTSAELRAGLVAGLRGSGVLRTDTVARAFATVPREAFLAGGFRGPAGEWVTEADGDFLALAYSNRALATKTHNGVVTSSSSQPSLMAVMLESLDVASGMRVLEIGTGTGYNAALLAAIGARVTSVEVQPEVAERSRAALALAGIGDVRVVVGDGYHGHPADGPYDRLIVTVGVTGTPSGWLDQLNPDGFAIVPTFHAGTYPVLRVSHGSDGKIHASPLLAAGFVAASGPMVARHRWSHPEPVHGRRLPVASVWRPIRWQPDLDFDGYRDLWFAIGAWHDRTTFAAMDGVDDGRGGCAILDDGGTGGAVVLTGGDIAASGAVAARCAEVAEELVERWELSGRLEVTAWRARLRPAGTGEHPLWVPGPWRSGG